MIGHRRSGRLRRRSDAQLRAACDALPDALLDLDERGVIESANGVVQSMFGYAPDELVGRSFREVVPALDLPSAFGSGESLRCVRLVALRRDGSPLDVEVSVGRATHGEREIYVAMVRDPSWWLDPSWWRDPGGQQVKEAQREVEMLREVARRVSGASHHVNNLLAGVLGAAEDVAAQLPAGRAREGIEVLRDAAVDAATKLRSLMTLVADDGRTTSPIGQVPPHEPRAPRTGGAAAQVVPDRTRPVVLLVDDEPLARTAARHTLERSGYRVLEASSAREAMQLFRNESGDVDVALVDVVLPDDSGCELGGTLRRFLPRPSVVYMSAYSPESLVAHGLVDEATPVVCKPFTGEALLEAVKCATSGGAPVAAD